jgi:HNH endonuclease
MSKTKFPLDIRFTVMQRAAFCCEYCKSQDKYSPNSFTIDHILSEDLGGSSDISNLAYACFLCNRLKWHKQTAFDVVSERWVRFFNPREDNWNDHFNWSEDATLVIGTSPIGRATVEGLKLNRDKLIEYRKAIIPFGTHPPS